MKVRELDWTSFDRTDLEPDLPFHYVIGADIVYPHEHEPVLGPLANTLRTLLEHPSPSHTTRALIEHCNRASLGEQEFFHALAPKFFKVASIQQPGYLEKFGPLEFKEETPSAGTAAAPPLPPVISEGGPQVCGSCRCGLNNGLGKVVVFDTADAVEGGKESMSFDHFQEDVRQRVTAAMVAFEESLGLLTAEERSVQSRGFAAGLPNAVYELTVPALLSA